MATLAPSLDRRRGRSGGPQGTLGGVLQNAVGSKPGKSLGVGDAGYLWILIALELGALVYGRAIFKRRHGG